MNFLHRMNIASLRVRVLFLAIVLACVAVPRFGSTNPTGANIRNGTISISGGTGSLTINQLSNRGIIEWSSFSIDTGETTRFNQPSSTAATLNRVTGASPSNINGNLFANGRVFLLNPNGILIGMNGVIDVGGFTASTLDVSDAEFLAGGDMSFVGPSQATVVNLGSISAADGDVFLIAASVLNQGSISAPNGTAGLAAGNDVLIKGSGHERVFVRGASGGTKPNGVLNEGTVEANVAELKAHGGNIYGMAVRNDGRVAATGVSQEGGQIFLRAGGGRVQSTGQLVAKRPTESTGGDIVVDAGTGAGAGVEIGGTVDAADSEGAGGTILVIGEAIDIFEGSLILADGDVGGGSIRIGGSREGLDMSIPNASNVMVGSDSLLDASAGSIGNGGEIIVYSTGDLSFAGMANAAGGTDSGDGGFVELTGKETLTLTGLMDTVDVSSTAGASGSLLIDSSYLDVLAEGIPMEQGEPMSSTNNLFAGDLSEFLEAVGSLSITTSSSVGGEEDPDIVIFSDAEIVWDSDNDLSFHSARDFRMDNETRIESLGVGNISIVGDRGVQIDGSSPPLSIEPSVSIRTGGSITIGNTDVVDAEGVDIRWAEIGSSGSTVSVTGFSNSAAPSLPAALNVENSHIEGSAGVVLTGRDTSSSGRRGVQIAEGAVSSDSGTISIEGTSEQGTGASLWNTTVDSAGGAITITGKTASSDSYEAGLLFYQYGPLYPETFVSNINNGMISLYGEAVATGAWAIGFIENEPVGPFQFIGGDGTQDVNVFGMGGDVRLSRVSADQFSYTQTPMAPGDFSLTNANVGSFSATGANDVTVENLGDLQIDGISNSGTVDISLVSGNLNVPGLISSTGTVAFSGEGVDQVFHIGQPLDSPLVDFSGSSSGLKVETEGTLNLNGYTFSNVLEVRGTGPGNNFLIAPDDDSTITLTTLTEPDGESSFLQTISADIGGVDFVSYDDISGGVGNDTFHVMLDEGHRFEGDLLGEEGDDRFVIHEGGDVAFIDGGDNSNTLDFSPFSSPVWVSIGNSSARQVELFEGIGSFVGGSSRTDAFRGTDLSDQFTITSENGGVLQFTSGKGLESYQFSGFEGIFGEGRADVFDVQLPSGVNFQGGLLGGLGEDLFQVGTLGSVNLIDGGEDLDILDFGAFSNPVIVDVQKRAATNVGAFSRIEQIQGGQSSQDRFLGTARSDRIDILSDTKGTLTVPSLTGGDDTVFDFSGFESIEGAAGNDLFVISNPVLSPFSMRLGGDAGNDVFQMLPGGGVGVIDGGADFDTINYAAFNTPVFADFRSNSATQVGGLANMENIVGGLSVDTLIGTDNADVFRIQSEDGGTLNAGFFSSFEILRGAGGNDQFLFSNQATVGEIFGGGGVDSLLIDDRTLGGVNTYVIGDDSISRNPTYTFNGLETLTLRLGPGDDTVVTSGNGLIQFINGGAGTDYLDLGGGNFITSNPIMIGGSKIYVSGFDGPFPPPGESDTLLTQQTQNRPPASGPSDGATLDQFSSTGVMGDFSGGNAFAASVAASAIAQQAIVLQVDGTQTLLQAPLSLDGTFTLPPEGVIRYLEENLEPDVWAELADAIDFEGAYLMIMADGPLLIDLSEATPADIASILASNLLAEAAGELLDALELAIVIPVTSLDGPVAIVTIPVPVDADIVALLTQLLADDAFVELTQALETE